MDKVKRHQQIIKQTLENYVSYMSGSQSEAQDVLVFDDKNMAYTVFDLGWQNNRRIQVMPVLMRIVGKKIYVEEDNTDYGFVDYLLEAGVPSEDIVLAWQPPELRQYTEFAAA